MACILEHLTSIKDLDSIWEGLQDNSLDSPDQESSDWEDKWEDWENESVKEEKSSKVSKWISNCCSVISPFGNLMVLSYGNRLAILKNRKLHDESSFHCTWKGTITDDASKQITSLFILPVYEHKLQKLSVKSTNIVVGFNTGHVSFFTEDAIFLHDFHFCAEPVMSFCANSVPINVTKPNLSSSFEDDFSVQYQNGFFVIMSGQNLVNVLQASRTNKTREIAGGHDRASIPPLSYKKYLFSEAKNINSLRHSGYLRYTQIDGLIDKSQIHGFNQTLPSELRVKMSLALTGGASPFFTELDLRTERDMMQGMSLSEIKQTIKTELKNSVKHLTDFSSYWKAPELPVNSKAIDVPVRYALSDERRICSSMQLSPSGRLAVLVDDFGRVILVDVNKSIVTRMWKGYRNAQCAWQTCDGEFQGKLRRISFLIIYSPNRGILEIWLPQSDKRAGAFNVPKDAKLIYNRHTVLGANQSHVGTSMTKYDGEIYQAIFLTNEGVLKTIRIPMLFGFRDIATVTDQDMHVIKDIRRSLRHKQFDEFFKLVGHVQTKDMKLEVIMLILNPEITTIEVTQKVYDTFLKMDREQKESEKYEPHAAYERSMQTVAQLLRLYKSLKDLQQYKKAKVPEDFSERRAQEEPLKEEIAQFLMQKSLNANNILAPFSFRNVPVQAVEIGDCFCDFLKGISYDKFDVPINENLTPLTIVQSNERSLKLIVDLLFNWCFSTEQFELFLQTLLDNGLVMSNVCEVFFDAMSNRVDFSLDAILRDAHIVLLLSVFVGDRPCLDVNPLWEKLQKKMRSWPDIVATLVAVGLCSGAENTYRSYYMDEDKVRQENVDKDNLTIFWDLMAAVKSFDCSGYDDFECEGLSLHMAEWNFLSEKLEKLIPVHQLVTQMDTSFDVSLDTVLSKGPGYITEIVAKYFVVSESNLSRFLDLKKVNKHVREIMPRFYSNFPESMDKDAIRVNYVWELGVVWSKNIEKISLLETMVTEMIGIQNGFYKIGIINMLWENRLKNHMHYAASLLFSEDTLPPYELEHEKVLPENLLGEFLEQLFVMFQVLVKGMRLCYVHPDTPPVPLDEFWTPGRKYPTSLAELCINEKETTPEIVYLHLHAILALNLAFTLDVKNHDIGSLFDELAREHLLEPLTTNYEPGNTKTSKSMQKRRKSFIMDIVKAVFDKYPLSDQVQIETYMEKIVNLCKEWYSSDDVANHALAIELFSSGVDNKAYSLLMDLVHPEEIVVEMTLVAIHRLHFLINNTSCGKDLCGCFNFETQRELRNPTKYRELRNPRCSIDALITLCEKIIRYASEDSMEQMMAKNLQSSLHGVNKTKIPAILLKEIS